VCAIVATMVRTKRNPFVLVATLSLLAVAIPSPARADCDSPRSALAALKQSDVVFRGTVREMKTVGERPSPGWMAAWIVTKALPAERDIALLLARGISYSPLVVVVTTLTASTECDGHITLLEKAVTLLKWLSGQPRQPR